jgi:hypothetical protein
VEEDKPDQQQIRLISRSEVFTAVKVQVEVFWVVTSNLYGEATVQISIYSNGVESQPRVTGLVSLGIDSVKQNRYCCTALFLIREHHLYLSRGTFRTPWFKYVLVNVGTVPYNKQNPDDDDDDRDGHRNVGILRTPNATDSPRRLYQKRSNPLLQFHANGA